MRSSTVARWFAVAAATAAFTLSVFVSGGTAALASGSAASVSSVATVASSDSSFQVDDFTWN
jgi:hypothetical protein